MGPLIHGPEQVTMLLCHCNVDSGPHLVAGSYGSLRQAFQPLGGRDPHRRLKAAVHEPGDRLQTGHRLPQISGHRSTRLW